MTEPTWWSYFRRVSGTEVGRVIAEAASVSEPQVSRWKSGKNRPDAEALVRFARHYKRPPVEALVAAGYLDVTEAADAIEVAWSLTEVADEELLAEIRRRMKGEGNADTAEESRASREASEGKKTEGLADDPEARTAMLAAQDAAAELTGGSLVEEVPDQDQRRRG